MIEHSIDIKLDRIFIISKVVKYTATKQIFANKIF